MDVKYKDISVIGFDLDQTLYPKSPETDELIQKYIYQKISDHKNCSLDEAERLFKDLYKNGNGLSGRKVLVELEIPNAENTIQEALEKAGITSVLKPDHNVVNLLKKLKEKYQSIDIITGSTRDSLEKKLHALDIPIEMFNNIITGEKVSKSTGEAYIEWLKIFPDKNPREFLYIGDRFAIDSKVPGEIGIKSILVNIKNPDLSINIPQLQCILNLEDVLL